MIGTNPFKIMHFAPIYQINKLYRQQQNKSDMFFPPL